MRDYYADCVGDEAAQTEFARLAEVVWEDLLEAGRYGADPGFLLHVLVMTKFLQIKPNIARSQTLQSLSPRRRASLLAGVRAILELTESGLQEIFGPQGHHWAQGLYEGAQMLHYELTAGTIETPAFQIGSRAKPSPRQLERLLTACVVCLMEALKVHPKPAAAAAVLLEKFELLSRSQSGFSAIEFVKKRASRAAAQVADRLGTIGNLVWHFRQTYENLREFLYPPSPRGH